MDINLLFEAGDLACSRVMNVLPEKEIKSPKQFMAKVLRTKTMPSINHLYPVVLRKLISTSDMEFIGQNTTYVGWRIPSRLVNGLNIQSVRSINTGTGVSETDLTGGYQGGYNGYIGNSMRMSAFPNKYGRYSSSNVYETVLSANMAYADLALLGTVQEAPIPRFERPNILWVNRSYRMATSFNMVLCLDNDVNLISLDDSVYEGVRRLFILDLKSTIYDLYSTWATIDTTLGNIDLGISDWSGCESERNELFDTFNAMSHIRRHTMISG